MYNEGSDFDMQYDIYKMLIDTPNFRLHLVSIRQ